MSGTLTPPIPVVGQPNSAEDPIVKESLEYLRNALNAVLNGENKVDPSLFSESQKIKYKFYETKTIAAAESTSSSSFTTLATPDQVPNVVIKTGGILFITYAAAFKSSVGGAGKADIFLNSTQLKTIRNTSQELPTSESSEVFLGIMTLPSPTTYLTSISVPAFGGIPAAVGQPIAISFIPEGEYTISIKYKATSGTVTAQQRQLNVWTIGS